MSNIILATDSYKLTHYNQYPEGTTGVYSYLEAREGAEYPETVFFGLQPILRALAGKQFSQYDITKAAVLANAHFGPSAKLNYAGWEHILTRHNGMLPIRIKAVPEGTVVPSGNVLMTVENTDPECYWLTNALESLLLHVWYPTTVATRSRAVKGMLRDKLIRAGGSLEGLDFMLHDFGYRGATTHDAAAIGGAGHLVSFKGTDTLPAMELAMDAYAAKLDDLAFSVPATEHSVMTALGREGEHAIVSRLIHDHPTGILSVVADSYDIYAFVEAICTTFKDEVLDRDGVLVIRPDSTTAQHPTPGLLVAWILNRLSQTFSCSDTTTGLKVLDPRVRVLWGDGIDERGIEKIVDRALLAGFSPENLVFGMGGGLLQKLNRDTQRFAFKSSAQQRDGVWHDVQKQPLDATKLSKPGRLALIRSAQGNLATVFEGYAGHPEFAPDETDVLQVVFENGRLFNQSTFAQVRERAAL